MSFDIKYDRNGNAIPSATVETSIQAAQPLPEQVEQPQEPLAESYAVSEPPVVETQPEDIAVEQPVAVAQPTETSQAKNFRVLREQKERAERENEELKRLMAQKEQPEQTLPEEDLDLNVDADALVEGKHLSKVDKKIKLLERKLAQYEQRSTENTAEARIRTEFPDYYSVVNSDNMKTLSSEYPEITQGVINTQDIYAKAKSTYMLIKKLGIAEDPTVVAEKALVMKNAAKPRPLASVSPQQGTTPMSQANAFANGLTKELKEQLAREVAEARRNM